MKTLITLYSLVLLVIYSGCDDSAVVPEVIDEGYTIHSFIVNWGGQANIILKAELYDTNSANVLILATDTVRTTGEFGFGLKDISDTMYYTMRANGGSCPFNINITPGSKSSNVIRFNLYNNTGLVGSLRRENNDSSGYSYTDFVYINMSMSMTGNLYCPGDTVLYNFFGVKGINKVTVKTNVQPPPHHTVTHIEPPGTKWYVNFITEDKKNVRSKLRP